ncbi:MAG: DUF58 domain-containing protein [Spirochaetales bacterium]|nr:DUF58 domain-containing protein [Spirochaetales bacterium]
MISREIRKKIELIRVLTRKKVTGIFQGEYESAFKGQGMEFREVREYYPGDDIRNIGWKVTARTGVPHVKLYTEERELNLIFLVDLSASQNFGTTGRDKMEFAAELTAVLSHVAMKNNDRVSLLGFTDRVELYIPPGRGQNHTMQMVQDLIAFEPEHRKTDLNAPLEYLGKVARRHSIVFIISDFIGDDYSKLLKISGRKHDLIGLGLTDPAEKELPPGGMILFNDPETGREVLVDTGSRSVREEFRKREEMRTKETEQLFLSAGGDFLTLNIGEDYIKPISAFFIRRGGRKR